MTGQHGTRSSVQITDLAWGVRQGLVLAALALTPAAIVAVARPLGEVTRFLLAGSAYLLFGAFAGLIVGAVRHRLERRSIAVSIGSIIGAIGISILMLTADPRGGSRLQLVLLGALLGLGVGATFGWWAWWRRPARQFD